MWKRKDVLPVLFLSILIIGILLTLSPLLAVHRHRSSERPSTEFMKFQTVVLNLEKFIKTMLRPRKLDTLSYRRELTAIVFSHRIQAMIRGTTEHPYHSVYNNTRRAPTGEFKTEIVNTSNTYYKFDRINRGIRSEFPAWNISESTPTRDITTDRSPVQRLRTGTHRKILLASSAASDGRSRDSEESGVPVIEEYPASSDAGSLELCSERYVNLVGPLLTNVDACNTTDTSQIRGLEKGGAWKPDGCVTQEKTAIIIPYRDRKQHLSCLLSFLVPVLQRQQLNFRMFVVEQEDNVTFNKGTLMNAAFNEAWKLDDFDCFIFHDVDLVPEDDRNLYTCASMPRHLSVAVDKFKYKLPYPKLVGGVLALRREQFLKVNGYSNLYWGWGAEDDDMNKRIEKAGYEVRRPPVTIARYKMIKHGRRSKVPVKLMHYLLKTVDKRYQQDGLNSAHYNVTFVKNTPLYTHVMINVGRPPKSLPKVTNQIVS